MRKLLVFALVTVIASCLMVTACGEPEQQTETATITATATETATATVEPIELRFSCPHPEQAGLVSDGLYPWRDDIEAASGGMLTINVFLAGSLAAGPDNYDAVASGLADMSYLNPEEVPGRFPLSDILCIPCIYRDAAVGAKAQHEIIMKYLADTELQEVKVLTTLPLVTSQYHSTVPLETLEDFPGVNIRSGGKMGDWEVEGFGATPVHLEIYEVRNGIERGLIDATGGTSEAAFAFGFNEVTPYRTKCDLGGKVHYIAINWDTWNGLPDDLKAIIEEYSTAEAAYDYGAQIQTAFDGAHQGLIGYDANAGNPGFYVLPEEERDRWVEIIKTEVWDRWVAEMEDLGLPGQEVLDEAVRLVELYSQ